MSAAAASPPSAAGRRLGPTVAKCQVSKPASPEPVDVAGDALPGTTTAQVCDLGFQMVAGAGLNLRPSGYEECEAHDGGCHRVPEYDSELRFRDSLHEARLRRFRVMSTRSLEEPLEESGSPAPFGPAAQIGCTRPSIVP